MRFRHLYQAASRMSQLRKPSSAASQPFQGLSQEGHNLQAQTHDAPVSAGRRHRDIDANPLENLKRLPSPPTRAASFATFTSPDRVRRRSRRVGCAVRVSRIESCSCASVRETPSVSTRHPRGLKQGSSLRVA